MKEHFDSYLNLRQLILDRKPGVIVECGAGNGELTRLIAHMQMMYPFEFHVISDKELDDFIFDVTWHTGISYKVLKEMDDDSIDFCIIDTDHNYWTIRQELEVLIPKMKEGSLIVMHDVEEFYYNTGMGMSYWDGSPYPEKEIKAQSRLGGVGLGLIDFIHDFRGTFKLVRYLPEACGAAVIEKRTITATAIVTPGPDAVFAKPVPVEA